MINNIQHINLGTLNYWKNKCSWFYKYLQNVQISFNLVMLMKLSMAEVWFLNCFLNRWRANYIGLLIKLVYKVLKKMKFHFCSFYWLIFHENIYWQNFLSFICEIKKATKFPFKKLWNFIPGNHCSRIKRADLCVKLRVW